MRILTLFSLLLVLLSCSNKRKEISDSVYLEKENEKYNLSISLDEEGAGQKFFDVDSLAIDSGTAFLIHGRKSPEQPKEWTFYGIPSDGSASPDIKDGKYALGDKRMYSLMKSAESWWNE